MTSVYILTIKETNEKHYFTSLVAIFDKFEYNVLKIKLISLSKHSFKRSPYENKAIKIEKLLAYSRADVKKEKERQ